MAATRCVGAEHAIDLDLETDGGRLGWDGRRRGQAVARRRRRMADLDRCSRFDFIGTNTQCGFDSALARLRSIPVAPCSARSPLRSLSLRCRLSVW